MFVDRLRKTSEFLTPATTSVGVIFHHPTKPYILMTVRGENEEGTGCISFPGGRIKAGEKPGEAARREMLEELGLCIDPNKLTRITTQKSLELNGERRGLIKRVLYSHPIPEGTIKNTNDWYMGFYRINHGKGRSPKEKLFLEQGNFGTCFWRTPPIPNPEVAGLFLIPEDILLQHLIFMKKDDKLVAYITQPGEGNIVIEAGFFHLDVLLAASRKFPPNNLRALWHLKTQTFLAG